MTRLHTLVPIAFFLTSPAFAGWSMTQVVTTTGEAGAGGGDSTQKMWVDGASAKVEFESSDNPMMERGTYLLVQEAGRKMFLVNSRQKTYARFDPHAMSSGMDAMGGGSDAMGAMEMKVENPKVEKILEEPGETLLGQETMHYRYHSSYTMTMAMATMKTATVTDIVEDVWTARGIELGDASQAMLNLEGGGAIAEIAKLDATQRATQTGLPIKRVVVTKSTTSSKGGLGGGMLARMIGGGRSRGGEESATTTTTAVKDLIEVALAPSLFQIPAGYAETELLQRGPAMPDLGGMEPPR